MKGGIMAKAKQTNKPVKLMVIQTGDIWYCNDLNESKIISGVPFIHVSRQPNKETYLMRKDVFKKMQG